MVSKVKRAHRDRRLSYVSFLQRAALDALLRITVRDMLEYLAGGMTVSEVLAEFPELTEDDIRACLAFAANQLSRPAA